MVDLTKEQYDKELGILFAILNAKPSDQKNVLESYNKSLQAMTQQQYLEYSNSRRHQSIWQGII